MNGPQDATDLIMAAVNGAASLNGATIGKSDQVSSNAGEC